MMHGAYNVKHEKSYLNYLNSFSTSFDTSIYKLDTITGQDITNPTILIYFFINFILYNLCKSYGIPYNKHNLHCFIPYFKVIVMAT